MMSCRIRRGRDSRMRIADADGRGRGTMLLLLVLCCSSLCGRHGFLLREAAHAIHGR